MDHVWPRLINPDMCPETSSPNTHGPKLVPERSQNNSVALVSHWAMFLFSVINTTHVVSKHENFAAAHVTNIA